MDRFVGYTITQHGLGILSSEAGGRGCCVKFKPCYENVALFLQNSPEWAGVLGYNEFTGGNFVLNQQPSVRVMN